MKTKNGIFLPVFAIFMAGASYSQTEAHSGILHSTSSTEEYNLLKIHCEGLQIEKVKSSVVTEFSKYKSEIYSFDIDQTNEKVYLKYNGTMNPNMILGILDRVNIRAYYMDNGLPIYFVKSGSENFVR